MASASSPRNRALIAKAVLGLMLAAALATAKGGGSERIYDERAVLSESARGARAAAARVPQQVVAVVDEIDPMGIEAFSLSGGGGAWYPVVCMTIVRPEVLRGAKLYVGSAPYPHIGYQEIRAGQKLRFVLPAGGLENTNLGLRDLEKLRFEGSAPPG